MNIPENSESDPPSLLRRRDFLALGSAGLLMPLFGNLAWAEPLAAAAAAAVQPMSVGYIDGSEEYRNLKWLPRKIRRPMVKAEGEETEEAPVIVPAASLFQADTSLPGQPLRIRVHGLYPPIALDRKRRREVPLAIDLEAIFPSPDPASPTPLRFFVWSLRQKPGWNPSPPVSFRFPLDWQVLPQFVLRVRGAGGATRCCGRSSPSTTRRASRSSGGASTSWGSIPSPGNGRPGSPISPAWPLPRCSR